MAIPHFVYPFCLSILSFIGHLRCIYILTIINNAAINICVQVELLGYMVILHLIIWRIAGVVSQNGHTILHSHQPCTREPVFPHSHQHLLLFDFFILSIIMHVKWYLSVVLIIFSWRHLCMCLLAICTSLEKCLFRAFAHFSVELSFYFLFFKKYLFIYFSFGCIGSLLLRAGFL